MQSITPVCTHTGLGSFPFARRYSGNRCFFLFLTLLRCFSSGGSLCMTMDSSCSDGGFLRRVSPFRNPWINGYLLLPMAYRSLSRLSSALSAKASAPCSFQLNQLAICIALQMLVMVLCSASRTRFASRFRIPLSLHPHRVRSSNSDRFVQAHRSELSSLSSRTLLMKLNWFHYHF